MPLEIVYRQLGDLVPYARNARKHSPRQVTQLEASLVEFGWTNPMLIADSAMIAGHGRLMAAINLRDRGVVIPGNPDAQVGPTIDLSHLTMVQRRAYVLADNKLAEEAEWDSDMLKLEFEGLAEEDFSLDLTGFSASEIEHVGNAWAPDMTRIEKITPELTALEALVKVRCNSNDVPRVVAAIEGALREAAIAGARVA